MKNRALAIYCNGANVIIDARAQQKYFFFTISQSGRKNNGGFYMCSICGQTPCRPGCPNAPEPKPAAFCSKCHNLLYPGDKALEYGDQVICKDCLDLMDAYDWLELIGEKMTEIEED